MLPEFRMIVPGATATTGLPMDAGRSIPLWNVPARGLFDRMRGPNGDDTQARSTGGSIGVLAGAWTSRVHDAVRHQPQGQGKSHSGVSPRQATVCVPFQSLGVLLSIRSQTDRTGTRSHCPIRFVCGAAGVSTCHLIRLRPA